MQTGGVLVLYCAEQFTNEQSAQNSILKAVKRAMAGEYSRELSKRSYAGHDAARLAASGQAGLLDTACVEFPLVLMASRGGVCCRESVSRFH